jgi:Ran GTPase-activating protein (RanGAP) involved in mRNA processing and transport
MPRTVYEIVHADTRAVEIGPLDDREIALSELERMNREAETGERAAYDDGEGGEVPAQRLVRVDAGRVLADSADDPLRAEDVGRLLHRGTPTGFELVIRQEQTDEERDAEIERSNAAMIRDAEQRQQEAADDLVERLRRAGVQIGRR